MTASTSRSAATVLAGISLICGVPLTVADPANAWMALVPLVYIIVGWLLATRRPENCVGWLCLGAGSLFVALGVQEQLLGLLAARGHYSAAEWVSTLGGLWVPALAILGIHLPLRLPTGRVLSRNWGIFARCCTVLTVALFVIATTDPQTPVSVPHVHNPLAVGFVRTLEPVIVLLPAAIVVSVTSLVVRYRRANGLERLQLRWISLSGLILGASLVPTLLQLIGVVDSSISNRFDTLAFICYSTIPVTIAIAVLRYRLYEIDRILNRALVYLALTGLLVAAYVGSVLLFGVLLQPLTRQSNLAVAVSTLVVAALFQPARRRIQREVDRRFFRSRYDAQRTLERFGGRLGQEVDLRFLNEDLRRVVAETLQPAHVSLWLRERT
jgi:hypothetical protein